MACKEISGSVPRVSLAAAPLEEAPALQDRDARKQKPGGASVSVARRRPFLDRKLAALGLFMIR